MRYLFVLLLLSGCASDMVKVAEPASVVIHWTREKPACPADEPACAIVARVGVGYAVCRITALETVDDALLGQEFRRCFGFVGAQATSAPYPYGNDMVKIAEPAKVVVSWRREAPTMETCRNQRITRHPQGCAQVARDHSRCRITAHEWSYDSLLGHELRHCFGWKHEADLKLRAR